MSSLISPAWQLASYVMLFFLSGWGVHTLFKTTFENMYLIFMIRMLNLAMDLFVSSKRWIIHS